MEEPNSLLNPFQKKKKKKVFTISQVLVISSLVPSCGYQENKLTSLLKEISTSDFGFHDFGTTQLFLS